MLGYTKLKEFILLQASSEPLRLSQTVRLSKKEIENAGLLKLGRLVFSSAGTLGNAGQLQLSTCLGSIEFELN